MEIQINQANFNIIVTVVEIFRSVIVVGLEGIWIFSNVLLVAVELRFLLLFFLNINPYYQPWLTLWEWTNPVFCFGRVLWPRIFGIDLAPIVNYGLISFLKDSLATFLGKKQDMTPPQLFENDQFDHLNRLSASTELSHLTDSLSAFFPVYDSLNNTQIHLPFEQLFIF